MFTFYCQTGNLTAGSDVSGVLIGTAGTTSTISNDTFNALTINAAGTAATTLSAFDALDGGLGNDTLNIYSDGADNTTLPTSATITNVETINIYNDTAAFDTDTLGNIDASRFEGATTINQIAIASTVTELAATTTAKFTNEATATIISVTAADAAATANIALSGVSDTITKLDVLATATGTLNAVNVAGSVTDTNGTGVNSITLNVTVGADVQTLTLNTSVDSTLAVTDGVGTKKVSTVDAAGSTGALTYAAAVTVANVTTGTGADVVTLDTTYTATLKTASVTTGNGNDAITVTNDNSVSDIADTSVTVAAGAGDDTINVNTVNGLTKAVALSVDAGDGDDAVTLTVGLGGLATTDHIIGGAGTDTVIVAGATLDAEDYIILNNVVTGFEGAEFTGATAAVVDASRMATYTTLTFAGNAGDTVTKVASTQTLVTNGDLTATATGYDAVTTAPVTIYGTGTLNIQTQGNTSVHAVVANANAVVLTVTATTNDDNTVDVSTATLTGDAKTASVTLVSATDTNATTVTTDDVLETADLVFTNATDNLAMTSLTISGNGTATVTNDAAGVLATVDASGMTSSDIDGVATTGLTYTTTNDAVAETIKLGSGLDAITFGDTSGTTGSTYLKMDTVTGLHLVDDATIVGKQVDAAVSDAIVINDGAASLTGSFVTATTTQTNLDLALTDMAADAVNDYLVFAMGGNTYIYADSNNDNLVSDTDIVIKLAGTVDLDLLVSAI